MSWSSSFSQNYVNPENLKLAEQEVDAFMDLYNRYWIGSDKNAVVVPLLLIRACWQNLGNMPQKMYTQPLPWTWSQQGRNGVHRSLHIKVRVCPKTPFEKNAREQWTTVEPWFRRRRHSEHLVKRKTRKGYPFSCKKEKKKGKKTKRTSWPL